MVLNQTNKKLTQDKSRVYTAGSRVLFESDLTVPGCTSNSMSNCEQSHNCIR